MRNWCSPQISGKIQNHSLVHHYTFKLLCISSNSATHQPLNCILRDIRKISGFQSKQGKCMWIVFSMIQWTSNKKHTCPRGFYEHQPTSFVLLLMACCFCFFFFPFAFFFSCIFQSYELQPNWYWCADVLSENLKYKYFKLALQHISESKFKRFFWVLVDNW